MSNKKISRLMAIDIIDRATAQQCGFDDWWFEMMDELGLYDEDNDTAPTLYDVLEAIGVSREECKKAGILDGDA